MTGGLFFTFTQDFYKLFKQNTPLKELVRGSVEETLNELLEAEAEKLTQAARYERSETQQGCRSGHYERNLIITSGDVMLRVPRLKGESFETAIIERYRLWESSVEEAFIEMYLAEVSMRRMKVSPSTISKLNKVYIHIKNWCNRGRVRKHVHSGSDCSQ